MLALAFAEKTLSGLVFSALVVGIATYFGQPFIFDPIVLIAIIAIAIFFRRDTDLLTICSVIIAERVLEELMWRFLENEIWFKIPGYLILLILALTLFRGWLRFYLIAFYVCAVAAEVNWFLSEYKAPYILWPSFTLMEAALLARFFKMRAFWMIEFNSKLNVRPLVLDVQLIYTFYVFVLLYSLYTFEYYIRHILGYTEVTYIYYSYPYIGAALALFKLWLVLVQSIEHLRSVELDA